MNGKRQNCFSVKIIELVPIMITITAARGTFIVKKREFDEFDGFISFEQKTDSFSKVMNFN